MTFSCRILIQFKICLVIHGFRKYDFEFALSAILVFLASNPH